MGAQFPYLECDHRNSHHTGWVGNPTLPLPLPLPLPSGGWVPLRKTIKRGSFWSLSPPSIPVGGPFTALW